MIDIESEVYSPLAIALRNNFSGISVSGVYVKSPSAFPFVSITESDNYPTVDHLDNGDAERFVTIMYEINVYSNKTSGRKSECKSILSFVDDYMYRHNFIRISSTPVPNLDNASIYRLVARYRAETDGTTIFRR